MDLTRKIIVLFVLLVCILIALLKYETKDKSYDIERIPRMGVSLLSMLQEDNRQGLNKRFYDESCPMVHDIIRSTFQELFQQQPDIARAFIRLIFHDCFVHGCDASILLESTNETVSEKKSPPNKSVRGFDEIDIIKSCLEKVCLGVVSCADIVVLAARESVFTVSLESFKMGRRTSIFCG